MFFYYSKYTWFNGSLHCTIYLALFFSSVQSEQSYNPIWSRYLLIQTHPLARRGKHISNVCWRSLYSPLTSNQKRIFLLCISVQCHKALYCFHSSCNPVLPLDYPDCEGRLLSWRKNIVVKAYSRSLSPHQFHIWSNPTFREKSWCIYQG